MKDSVRTSHESFGMAGFSRSSIGGKGVYLFGSSIKHNSTITFRVHHAEVDRHLEQDWFHATDRLPIVEIEMSQSQFAEMITSMNMGDGVPVTIRSIYEHRTEPCPHESKRMQHSNEFKQSIRKTAESLKDAKVKMQKLIGKLPKKDQEELLGTMQGFIQEIESNIPFYEDQFTRQMNKTVTEAKSEVEAFVTSKIHNAGIQAILKDADAPKTIELE